MDGKRRGGRVKDDRQFGCSDQINGTKALCVESVDDTRSWQMGNDNRLTHRTA